MIESVWKKECSLPEFPKLYGEVKTDVLIVGGGLAGLLCAHRLARAGADHVLIEADRICGGVSGNTTAKITSQHGLIYDKLIRKFDPETARRYWMANEDGLRELRKLAREVDCDFQEKDNFIYSVDSPRKLEKELAALEQIGAPAELVQTLPLPFAVAGAIRFPNQAQFHPLKLAAGLEGELNIYEHTPALAFEGNTVVTDQGRITAEKIIVATHFPILNKHGAYYLKMYQARSYVLALEGAPELNGMYLDEAKGGLSFRNYADLLLLGGGGHRTGKRGGGWRALEAFARANWPEVRERYRWAAQDCMTLDGIPYIGRYGGKTTDLYVATGFNKWGMTSAAVSAGILADLVMGKENPYADLFSPQRRILRPQLLCNGAEAVVNLLTPTVPRCPHMGCALKWNPQEHSWDCPCHGSRFDRDGKLLDDPATGELKHKPKR